MDVTVFFGISHAGHLKKCFGIGLWKPWKSLIKSQNTDVMGQPLFLTQTVNARGITGPVCVFNHEHSLDKEDSVGLPTLVNSGCLKAFAVNQIQLIKAMFTYVQSPVLSSCTTISA